MTRDVPAVRILPMSDKLDGFRRLERFVRTVETSFKPRANFHKLIQHEHAISPALNGRTVFDDKQRSLF